MEQQYLAKITKLEIENNKLRKKLDILQKKMDSEKYKSIYNELSVGILIYDNNLQVIDINKKISEICRKDVFEAQCVNLKNIFNIKIQNTLKKALVGHEGFYQGKYSISDGSHDIYISIHTKPKRNSENEIIGGIAIINDITEDQLAENAINKSYDIFQTVTDNISIQVYVVDLESNRLLFMNRKAIKTFGNKIKNTCWGTLEKYKNANKNPEKFPYGMVSGGEYYNETLKQWFKYSYTPIKWIDDRKAILVTSGSISAQKDAETKVKIQNEKLEVALKKLKQQNEDINKQAKEIKKSSETKNKMFSIIGHDLRGPIGNVKNALEIILEDYKDLSKKEIQEFIFAVRDSSSTAYNLLANLLYWAKNQSEQIHFVPEQISVNELVDESLSLFNGDLTQKKIKIKFTAKEEFKITADENMVYTVIRNLISNAIKFTNVKGKIDVRLEKYQENKKNYVKLSVKDNGIGIKKEKIEKILNTKDHYTTYGTNNEKGSGLGIVLCKEFIEKHNGKLWLESKVGKGTTFSCIFPIS